MTQKAVDQLMQSLEDAGCKVTRINLGDPPNEQAWTVAQLVRHLQMLPQDWRVQFAGPEDADGLGTLYPINGMEWGSGEVWISSEDEDEAADHA